MQRPIVTNKSDCEDLACTQKPQLLSGRLTAFLLKSN